MTLTKSELEQIEGILGRKPNKVEITIFDTMWSEHCSYKSSKRVLKQYLPTKGSEVALGIGEDSGIIRLKKVNGVQYCVAVSHESHNHPSQILPIEGAATGIGGVVRDVYCMGADVFGVVNSLHFGMNTDGQSPIVEEIEEKVIQGVSEYGNPLGVPVLGGETLYHPSYNDNCLVNVAAVGIIAEDQIIHSFVPEEAKKEPYDIILIGKSTDATGFGGASFSSASLDKEDAAANIGAVQVHDPFMKRVIVEALKALFKRIEEKKVSVGFKDLGAGGISCAASEIAAASGFGVVVDLSQVPLAVPGLPPEVICCSETQERFCLAVPKSFTAEVLKLFNEEFELPRLYPNAGASVIGETTTDPVFRVHFEGQEICSLPVHAITTEVQADRKSQPRPIVTTEDQHLDLRPSTVEDICKDMIQDKRHASKRYVYRFFDNAVRGDTVLYPGEADATVVTPIQGDKVGVAVSMDSNLYGMIDPFTCGASAVAESVRNVIAVGARPIAVTDCLNYGNPEKPDVFFDFEKGVEGIGAACNALGFIDGEALPIISGNVSLYNESKQGKAVTPSPVILTIARVEDFRISKPMQLSKAGLDLILVGKRYSEWGGTALSHSLGIKSNCAPQVRFQEEAAQNKVVYALYNDGKVQHCHDISSGGLWTCLTDMVFGERGVPKVGIEIQIASEDLTEWLFSENGGYVIACNSGDKSMVLDAFEKAGVWAKHIGVSTSDRLITVQSGDAAPLQFDAGELAKGWVRFNDI